MSRLTCSQCQNMLLDAADGVLLTEDETHFRLHLADCPTCTGLFADVQRGSAWMDMLKADPPSPPADLVDRILAATSGDPVLSHEVAANVAHAASLFGHSQGARIIPFKPAAPQTFWGRMAGMVMQPRFAMTAAMAFFSIALTMNIAGVRLSSLHASDLAPSNLRKSFWAANNQVVRYYDNLRVVYELESRVHEMQKQSDDSAPQRGIKQQQPQQEEQQPQRQPGGQPRSSSPHLHPLDPSQSERQHPHLLPVREQQPMFRAAAAINDRGDEGVRA